ncbi:kinase-like domain-containing protein [Cristinia sonorae]|uniref:Kinase-like domain-containing protein n=1 Tax=Cristinia sonorae TaxID=1940300 RepID=A0A8K0UN38_9AGAR|nr:kinase-like domain-containing protein [Cristinia sonorae]
MTMHGAVQDGERVMLVLDLMKCDLFALLEDQIPRPTIRRWIAQIALGIDALHAIGIIHRDIKPENILLCPDGLNVRITDFTNAYLDAPLPDPEDDDPDAPVPSPRLQWWRKYSKHVIGTVHYLAPEVVEKKWYGLAVDYWALGCVLYDLVVGSPLFPNKSTMREYTKWVRDGHSVAEYFQQRTPILTDEELDLLSGLLCLEPDNRFRLEHLESHPYFTIDSEYVSLPFQLQSPHAHHLHPGRKLLSPSSVPSQHPPSPLVPPISNPLNTHLHSPPLNPFVTPSRSHAPRSLKRMMRARRTRTSLRCSDGSTQMVSGAPARRCWLRTGTIVLLYNLSLVRNTSTLFGHMVFGISCSVNFTLIWSTECSQQYLL